MSALRGNMTQTVKQCLLEMFGESANAIHGMDNPWIVDTLTNGPKLVIRDTDGGIFVHCGGECLISFSRHDNIRGQVFLVRDDQQGSLWEVEQARAREEAGHYVLPTRPKPSPVLRLAYSV